MDETERKVTKHDVRAWIRLAQAEAPGDLHRWIHILLTSYDPLDSARTLMFVRAHHLVVAPLIKKLITELAHKIDEYCKTLQIGRTHGQHALPITVGFWLATILSRIIYNANKMNLHAGELVGKISGAVGAYNAQVGLGVTQKCGSKTFEERVLEKVGLKPALISTQILPPEPLAYYLFSCTLQSASLAQFGRDCRNLMRSEIGEIGEPYEQGQVGSSTMAHKRNPITFENIEGMFIRTKNEFGKVMDTLISEHQRDLVASCVYRDFPIILVNLVQQLSSLLRPNKEGKPFIARLAVDKDACQRNFAMNANVILAEPIYIALQMAGYNGDAHKLINEQVIGLAKANNRLLIDVVKKLAEDNDELYSVVKQIPQKLIELFYYPEKYIGLASDKAIQIAIMARKFVETEKIIINQTT